MATTDDDALRERLARWLFERNYRERGLASPEDAPWDGWVERNRDQWREEADALLSLMRDDARNTTRLHTDDEDDL